MAEGPWEQFQTDQHPADKFADRFGPWNKFKQQEQPGFVSDMGNAASSGWEKIKGAVTQPGVAPTSVPKILGGASEILGAPISAAGAAIERQFPSLKKAQQQGQILPLESAADVIGTATGLVGGRAGVPKPPPAAPAEASLVRKVLAPASTEMGEKAATALREAGGTAARRSAQTQYSLTHDPQQGVLGSLFNSREKQINQLPPQDRFKVLDYIEGRSAGATLHDPSLQGFADEFRDAMQKRRNWIENSPSAKLNQTHLLEDYARHYWKDQAAARTFVNRWMSKQGSSASLKKRTIPTIADGIKAGLVPLTDNPIEIAMRYVTSMDKYITMNEAIEAGKQAGTVKFFRPGANNIPDNWVPLEGYISKKTAPTGHQWQAYAPADWATIWNRYVSQGAYASPLGGQVYDAVRRASNMATQTTLALSGYHAMAMAKEAILSTAAKGLGQAVGGTKIFSKGILKGDVGEVLRGAKIAAKGAASMPAAAVAPVTTYLRGKKFQNTYLGRGFASPDYRHMVDLFEKAGGRAVGKAHAPDYEFSNAGSFFTSFKRGSLKMEARGALRDIMQSPYPPVKAAGTVVRAIGRTFETIGDPLFKEYIPALKSGAFSETMSAWLEANPGASPEHELRVAQKIVDAMDDRFGEMIQDNIFWSTLAKQLATVGMLSYSWNLGDVRAAGGGAASLVKTAGRALDITSKDYAPNAGWIVAVPMVLAAINAIYQYIKTGKPPESAHDLMAGRTGGQVPGFGGHGTVEERAITPGYDKDFFGWYQNMLPNEMLPGAGYGTIGQEVYNKMNPLVRMGYDAARNRNWRDDPITRPDPTVPQWLEDYFKYVMASLGPISFQRLQQGEKTGSKFGLTEEILGIRQAPALAQDPESYRRGMSGIANRKWKDKERHDRALQRAYGGTQ